MGEKPQRLGWPRFPPIETLAFPERIFVPLAKVQVAWENRQ